MGFAWGFWPEEVVVVSAVAGVTTGWLRGGSGLFLPAQPPLLSFSHPLLDMISYSSAGHRVLIVVDLI